MPVGRRRAFRWPLSGEAKVPAPAESINIVFSASCPANSKVTYRLFWALPEEIKAENLNLPIAKIKDSLQISGDMPGLVISNKYYTVELNERAGSIQAITRAGQSEDKAIAFRKRSPIHYGLDVWSAPVSWDHEHDWLVPPNQKGDGGPIAFRYYRWGPMPLYSDVISTITYTFYANSPYIHVSSTMEFTADRSARAVRMGEIVVTNTRKPKDDLQDTKKKFKDIFSHYAWPNEDGSAFSREINVNRDADGYANIEGLARGTLAILDRDIPWIAGYNLKQGYGIASLRKSQFAGNRFGGPILHSAPSTCIGNYGWGFVYWSRPMACPMGKKGTPIDHNMAVAAGTIYATEEALLIFEPDTSLSEVSKAHLKFTKPLRFQFKGTGPW